ncbi:unnamed protein product [Arabidopsis thaliana]|uniref:(thale cress) hypothetical protein n=1 Tax=Arabidopsis thaliana TaxID=3702 RepID=A0A7G2F243_ARATH|nr:unnamed protein product [Arabidopsis thaliana]
MSYILIPILTDIVDRVGHDGFRERGPFIAVGPQWLSIAFSNEVLAEVCLDEFIFVSPLTNALSPYRPFLLRCLAAGNKTATYVEGLGRAAQLGPSTESLDMLGTAAQDCLYARFAFSIFLICCGNYDVGDRVLGTFLQKVPHFPQALEIAEQVVTQIKDMGTSGNHAYRRYLRLNGIPACHMVHFTDVDVCPQCFALNYAWEFTDLT